MSEKFQEFYSVYPRKVGKLDAEKAFRQMTARFDENEILDGAKKFARLMAAEGKEQQFIPYPASWLRAGRWMDGELVVPEKIEPLFRPARTVDELKAFYQSAGKTITPEINRARSVEELPAFARMVPKDWQPSNVHPITRRA